MAPFHNQVVLFAFIMIIGVSRLQSQLVDGLSPNKLNALSDSANDEVQNSALPAKARVLEAAKGSSSEPHRRLIFGAVGNFSVAGIIRMILNFFHLLLTPPTPAPPPMEPVPTTYPPYALPVPPSPTVPITYRPSVPTYTPPIPVYMPPAPTWPSPIVPITYTPPTYTPPTHTPPTYTPPTYTPPTYTPPVPASPTYTPPVPASPTYR